MKFYSTKRHKTRVEIVESELIPESFDNISIGYFSDVLSNLEVLNKSMDSFQKKDVDIILFGGNLLKNDLKEEAKLDLIEKLKTLNAPLGKYAVLGEEDLNTQAYEILEAAGFRHLTMSGSKIHNFQDEYINLIGFDSDQLSYETKDDIFEILLSNDPKIIDTVKGSGFDLILSGKYLGGQFKLPFFEPLGHHANFYKKRYDINKETFLLSQGIGTYDLDMRLNTKPETLIIILKKLDHES